MKKDYLVCTGCKRVVAVNCDPDSSGDLLDCGCNSIKDDLFTGTEFRHFYQFMPKRVKLGQYINFPTITLLGFKEIVNIIGHGDPLSYKDSKRLSMGSGSPGSEA